MWLLSDPITLILLIIALLGFAVSVRYALLNVKKKDTKENKSKKRFFKKWQLVLLVIFIATYYITNNKDKWIEERNKTKRIEHKIEMAKQYKLLKENANKVGKWRSIEGSEYVGFYGALYISIYKKDNLYSMVLYSEKGEIIDIHQLEDSQFARSLGFGHLVFAKESQDLIRCFGTLRDTCERID